MSINIINDFSDVFFGGRMMGRQKNSLLMQAIEVCIFCYCCLLFKVENYFAGFPCGAAGTSAGTCVLVQGAEVLTPFVLLLPTTLALVVPLPLPLP